jgi:hypothetical protein
MTLWIPRAFHELDVSTRSKDQLNRWTPVTEGPAKTLRRLPALDTFAAPEKDHRPRSWSVPFSFAGHCASLPPCGVPRSRCQSASSSLLQPTFTSRAPEKTSLSETARRAPWETHRRSTSRPLLQPWAYACDLRAAPDHLAVIRPPTAARLTARLPASGPSTPIFRHVTAGRSALVTRKGRRPGVIGRRCLCRNEPSDTSLC